MIPDINDHNLDGIIEDERALAIKSMVMERLKKKNIHDAISKVAMFAGTMLMTATTGVVLGGLLHGGGFAALTAALTTPVIAALAIGAAIIAVAVVTDYIGSYIGQGANFDVQEASADSTARHMRKEFEAGNLVVIPSPSALSEQEAQKSWATQAEADKLKRRQQTTLLVRE